MENVVNFLNGIIWSPALVYLCLGTGLYFSVRTRFLQVRHMRLMLRLLFRGKASERGVSSYQAFALAVSGRVGTGNIAGVATAIAIGGPGAVFWMWAIAFLGAGSAFVEAALAQIYKEEIGGQYRGGPAYYIERGLKTKWYAVLFALSTVLATGLFLPGVQANSIASAIENAFAVPPAFTGATIVVLLGLIIFGGVKRISRAAEFFVPIMATGYLLMALVIIALHFRDVPAVFALIFNSAFGVGPVFGGIVGQAIAWGVKRGVYSNEAGQGTAPMAAAAAEVKHPAEQGLVQAFSIYFDTWLVCSATAFMILLTGKYNVANPAGGFLVENVPGTAVGPAYTQAAVDSVLPGFGSGFVAIALLFFAFTTIMAYYYYAETNLTYLHKQGSNRWLFHALRAIFLLVVFYGTQHNAEIAWALGDIGVGLMAWLNIIAILLLTRPALTCLRHYEAQLKAGTPPRFVAAEAGIDNAPLWKSAESLAGPANSAGRDTRA
ncbi:MAG TPA: alanine/glycine:cation symporter family protein [Opitutaceae bacterium]